MKRDYNIKVFFAGENNNDFFGNIRYKYVTEILYGIEEEGLFSELIFEDDNEFNDKVYNTCISSPLGIAVGISQVEVFVCIKKLKRGSYLFIQPIDGMCPETVRIMGHNVAKFVICRSFIKTI